MKTYAIVFNASADIDGLGFGIMEAIGNAVGKSRPDFYFGPFVIVTGADAAKLAFESLSSGSGWIGDLGDVKSCFVGKAKILGNPVSEKDVERLYKEFKTACRKKKKA